MDIIFSQEANIDLQRLRQFIYVKNPSASRRIAQELKQGILQLATFPLMGRKVEGEEDIREYLILEYVVRYQIKANAVIVVRIWHGKENERNETINEPTEEYSVSVASK